jgi:hypothetical protein
LLLSALLVRPLALNVDSFMEFRGLRLSGDAEMVVKIAKGSRGGKVWVGNAEPCQLEKTLEELRWISGLKPLQGRGGILQRI